MKAIIITPHRAIKQAQKHRKFLAEQKTNILQHRKDVEARRNGEPDLHHFLIARGEPATFTHKAKLAKQLGMGSYYGKTHENAHILKMIKLREGYQKENPKQEEQPNVIDEYMKLLN
jgi:hypothetical protein